MAFLSNIGLSLLCTALILFQATRSVPMSDFFPFGVSINGDVELVTDDASVQLSLDEDFVIYNRTFTNVHVSKTIIMRN